MEEPVGPTRERERKAANKKKDDFGLLLTQVIVCAIALLAVFSVKMIGGKIYKETREKYIEMFNDKTGTQDIIESISRALDLDTDSSSSKKSGSSSKKAGSGGGASGGSSAGEDGGSSQGAQSGASSAVASSDASGPPPEEEGDAAFIEDYAAVSGRLANSAAAMNTMLVPVSGRVTDTYGYRVHPVTGVYSMHSGIDFGADMNTPISAAQSGTVLTVSYSSSYGKYIILSHSGGLRTLYAHCSSISAKTGEEIQRGQTIGKVGSTGVSTGPHLHFEVRIGGTRINPAWVLRKLEIA